MVKRTVKYSKGCKSMVAKYKEGGGVGGIGGGSGVDGSGNRGNGGYGGGTSGNQGGGGMGGGGKGGVGGTGISTGVKTGISANNRPKPSTGQGIGRPKPAGAPPPKANMPAKPKPVGMAPKPKSIYSGYGTTGFSPKDEYGTRQALGSIQADRNKGSANQVGKGNLGAGINGFNKGNGK